MNGLVIVLLACMVVAEPSAIWGGYGHAVNVVPAGPTTLIGASGIVGPNGASGPSGSVNGHGAVGPSGEHNAPALHDAIWGSPALIQHAAVVAAPTAHAIVAPGIAHGLGLGWGHGGYWH
ncbi:hypothetical protein FQR65_LT04161 [Abscondita terminalis]|nr:hypothetical protein FQR65_LT04161 [Abscondita terminalis]